MVNRVEYQFSNDRGFKENRHSSEHGDSRDDGVDERVQMKVSRLRMLRRTEPVAEPPSRHAHLTLWSNPFIISPLYLTISSSRTHWRDTLPTLQ